ncbi:G patch domain-containing protein 1 [Narcine bancroftii]|uniref:G patch domain-containing protein 1 n=1 Tax=Narcine bancroftii TaxID=1343680 RepID=UPI003831A606
MTRKVSKIPLLPKMAAAEEEEGEDFVYFGSALEEREDQGTSLKKPIPLQEQTVKDEKGRYKRFHGAFTGGFSAGYFNSVGSKEGWTPSTFVSSRQRKAEKQLFNPEHFMDEEDLEEHGIAPRGIVTTSDFASKAKDEVQEKSRALASVTGPIPGATILDDLITAAKITIGVQLLRKMGWKEGQGLGPRVKRTAQRQRSVEGHPMTPHATKEKVYGCSLPDEGLHQSQEEQEGEEYLPDNVTFAPKDVMPLDFIPKDDRHGLGYSGIDPRRALYGTSGEELGTMFHTDSSRSHSLLGDALPSRERKLGITGQAFGVGALEEDDDDIYARDSLSRYDSVLREEEPEDGLFGWTAPQQFKKAKGSFHQIGYVGKLLEGFHLGSKTTKSIMVYGPPDLPRDYRPVHYFRPMVSQGTISATMAQALEKSMGQLSSNDAGKGRHQLNATQRRELLGERALQGPRSVFDLLAEEDRERLQKTQQAACCVPGPHLSQPMASQLRLLDSRERLAGWSGFKPFQKDPQKQRRYEEYLRKLNAGQRDALASSLDPSKSEWEQGHERDEFRKAAALYRPISASLSSRFTSAKHAEDTDQVEVLEQQEGDVKDKEAAVKMKMFGALTRDKFEWHPDKLLCKRFNVPDPYRGSTVIGLLKVKRDKYSVFNFLTVPTVPAPSGTGTTSGAEPSNKPCKAPESKRKSRWDISAEDQKKDSTGQSHAAGPESSSLGQRKEGPGPEQASQVNDEEEVEEEESRPPLDLFQAIFASSSEEKSSSSSSEEEDEDASGTNASPERGDEVKPSHQAVPAADQPGLVKEQGLGERRADGTTQPLQCSPQTSSEEFGPRLPPALLYGAEMYTGSTTCQEGREQGRDSGLGTHKEREREKHGHRTHQEEKQRRKHKDRRKSKKQKKDMKRKHKRHKQRRKVRGRSPSSSSSSEGEGEESRPLAVVDLLKRLKNVPLTQH